MNLFDPLTRLAPASLRRLFVPGNLTESAERLAAILNVAPGELASIRMGPRYHYRPFAIAKPDGRERRICAPSPALKSLQRRLLDNYLGTLPIHEAAMAFRPGYSIVHNARQHARNQLIATVDLRDFFESTRAARVRAFFVKLGWRGEEIRTLMRLCVLRDGLPQGAPTSPCLSNLVNAALDERLWRLARRSHAVYTRYGDDLTFSWQAERLPTGFQRAVEDCLHTAGYEIQPCKGWRVSSIRERPMVTGLILTGNGRVRVPWAARWRVWRLWWKSWWSSDAETMSQLSGYRGFVRMVH